MSTQSWLLVLLLTGEQPPALGQDLSHRGKSFWLIAPLAINSLSPVVYMSAGPNRATVTFTGHTEAGSWQKVYQIPANTTIVSDILPANMGLVNLSSMERVYDRSVHIESDTPIVAYAHFYENVYSGATLLIPEETWGYSYVAASSPGDHGSYVCVTAACDNTVVEIVPSARTSLGSPAGVPIAVTLNKGQTYQLLAGMYAGELTGTSVRSVANAAGTCYPVAVFSGSTGTPICGSSSDFIIQQLFPYQTWGKRYVTAPWVNPKSANSSAVKTSIYRVAVKDPSTVVKWNGAPLTGLVNGLYYEFHSDVAAYIEADQPVMVVQFMTSQDVQGGDGCNFAGGGLGDPEMMILSPLEQAFNRADFYLSYQSDILYNYVSVIVPTAGLSSLRIDGGSTYDYSYPHPNLSGYSVVIKRWIAAGKSCIVQCDSAFLGSTYGVADYESYAYNITPLKNLTSSVVVGNEPDSGRLSVRTCTGLAFKWVLQTTYTPSRIEWDLSKLPQLVHDGSPVTANPVIDHPSPDSTIVDKGTVYGVYSFPSYYTFTAGGIFTVPVSVTTAAIDNCSNRQTFTGQLTVFSSPAAAFDAPAAVFIPDGKVSFTNRSEDLSGVGSTDPGGGASDLALLAFRWDFGDGTGSAATDPEHSYADTGDYRVTLTATGADGCPSDTAAQLIRVLEIPLPPPIQPPPAALRVPNAFSPNGDGLHDTWEIPGLSGYPDAIVQVFDRWGQKVFVSKGYGSPWDGSRNGHLLPEGVYYYIIEPGDHKARLTGALHLLR